MIEANPDAGWEQLDVDATRCFMTPSSYEARVVLDAGARRWHVMVVPAGECMQNMFGGGAERRSRQARSPRYRTRSGSEIARWLRGPT